MTINLRATIVYGLVFSIGILGALAGRTAHARAQQAQVGVAAISGLVTSANGPEAGVWVIAETNELPTKFAKIVVTNDAGRFLLPNLPNATYDVWVRGYGLVDSTPVKVRRGGNVALKAVAAKTPQDAVKVYPANYWYSLLEVPAKSEFPGTGPRGNGISTNMRSQEEWIHAAKNGCEACHQLGNEHTRQVTHLKTLGLNTMEAWDYRVQAGQRGGNMTSGMNAFGRMRGLKMFADWSDRIAKGEVPAEAPARPIGVERNVVLTLWDWGTDSSFVHEIVSTAKTKPTVNAGRAVHGASNGHGTLVELDPLENRVLERPIPMREANIPNRQPQTMLKPSPVMGSGILWPDGQGGADPHSLMMDTKGRTWVTSRIRRAPNPDWCKEGSSNKFSQFYPIETSPRQVSIYDPKTGKWSLIDTCFGTHHVMFGEDPNETAYFTTVGATGGVMPWVDSKIYDQTQDEKAAQGWCPLVLDTNGDGKIAKPWNEPARAARAPVNANDEMVTSSQAGKIDPTRDTLIMDTTYGVVVSPLDHSAWGAVSSFPGRIIRVDKGNNAPQSCMTEMYELPPDGSKGFGPRGIDVDRNGIIWVAQSGSGGFASFDRRKCKVMNGPSTANGRHCDEGWTFYPLTVGPNIKGTNHNADFHYLNWVDQFNASGLGANLPIATGSGSDSLLVLKPDTKEWITLRVPYPLGFFSRALDGRIDNPKAGWKGRGLWAAFDSNAPWHTEGGRGTKSKIVHFQIRPNPLAQ